MVRLRFSKVGTVSLAIAMACGFFHNGGCRMRTQLEQLLPQGREVEGLVRAGTPQYFSNKQLIEYINGGAELYFAYGFVEMVVCRYQLSDGSNVTVEIYEMDRPENAYGIYSLDTDGSHPEVGQEAAYAAGLLKFWKGRFFVRILAETDSAQTREAATEAGKNVASKIAERGSKPAIVGYVPDSGVIPESVQFFHKQVALNNVYYIADENLLHLDEATDAISYRYRIEDASIRVLFVQYPTDVAATDAFGSFVETYLEADTGAPTVVQEIEDGTFCGAKRTDNFVVLVFEAPARETCLSVLETASRGADRAAANKEGTV